MVRALEGAEGRLWSDGFFDDPRASTAAPLSLWRDTAAATAFAYAPGVHQDAVKAQREGGWFTRIVVRPLRDRGGARELARVGADDLLAPYP